MEQLTKLEKIALKGHPTITEKILQKKIADDPSIIGLGDLVLKDKERIQPRAGRLDLLLQDPDNNRRYEVELQLGKTDESHLIRTIEYWDIEKKRYPQYDHCAVIIAEQITSRFLNVISLFNGFIPLIAIQLNAVKIDNGVGLVFTKVLDELALGLIEEDEEVQEVADREYWLKQSTKKTVEMADQMLKIINSINEDDYELNYNKFYIGLVKDGNANNFAYFRPKKKFLNLNFKHPKSDEIDMIIKDNDFDDMGYGNRGLVYRLRVDPEEIEKKKDVLKKLMEFAEQYRNG